MILIEFIRFLRGYIHFTCTGGFSERFINLCSLNGIILWDTKNIPDGIEAKAGIRHIEKLKLIEEKSGMKMQIKSCRGLPVAIAPYLARKGLVAGVIAAVCLVIYLSGFLWVIDISGNVNYTSEQILELCAGYGVKQGARLDDIDVYRVINDIKTDSDDFSWFAVNIFGSGASVELTERLAKTQIHDKTTPCNIVSGTDGEIIELYSLSGEPQVKIGSAVKKGDLLISGITPRLNGTVSFVHAMGHAVIRTTESITVEIPRTAEISRNIEITEGCTIRLFSAEIPLYPYGKSPSSSYTSTLIFRGKALPVSVTRHIFEERTTELTHLTESRCMLLAYCALMKQEIPLMQSSTTESKKISLQSTESSVKITAEYINHKQTGEERFFEILQEE